MPTDVVSGVSFGVPTDRVGRRLECVEHGHEEHGRDEGQRFAKGADWIITQPRAALISTRLP